LAATRLARREVDAPCAERIGEVDRGPVEGGAGARPTDLLVDDDILDPGPDARRDAKDDEGQGPDDRAVVERRDEQPGRVGPHHLTELVGRDRGCGGGELGQQAGERLQGGIGDIGELGDGDHGGEG